MWENEKARDISFFFQKSPFSFFVALFLTTTLVFHSFRLYKKKSFFPPFERSLFANLLIFGSPFSLTVNSQTNSLSFFQSGKNLQ